jgi:hypothetical protein
VLDFLGFPWILSSESRLFNGLRGTNRERFFIAVLPRRQQRWEGILQSRGAGAQNCSWRKLSLISDYLQEIAGSYSVRCWSLADPSFRSGRGLSVMAGLDPAIPATSARFANRFKFMKHYQLLDRHNSVFSWMAGPSPAMTENRKLDDMERPSNN